MVSSNQIWEYRRDPKYSWEVPDEHLYTKNAIYHTRMAWVILGGEIRGTDFFWTAKVIRDEIGFLEIATTHTFAEEVFKSEERFRLIYDPSTDKSGIFCTRCGDFYPYAAWKPSFECWGCRSGF